MSLQMLLSCPVCLCFQCTWEFHMMQQRHMMKLISSIDSYIDFTFGAQCTDERGANICSHDIVGCIAMSCDVISQEIDYICWFLIWTFDAHDKVGCSAKSCDVMQVTSQENIFTAINSGLKSHQFVPVCSNKIDFGTKIWDGFGSSENLGRLIYHIYFCWLINICLWDYECGMRMNAKCKDGQYVWNLNLISPD